MHKLIGSIIAAIVGRITLNEARIFVCEGLRALAIKSDFSFSEAADVVYLLAGEYFPHYGHGKADYPPEIVWWESDTRYSIKADAWEIVNEIEASAKANPSKTTEARAFVANTFAEEWQQAVTDATYEKWKNDEDWPEEYSPGYFANKWANNLRPDGNEIVDALAWFLDHVTLNIDDAAVQLGGADQVPSSF